MSAAVPSMYELVSEARVTAVPGLLHWLGLTQRPDTEPEETYEALCERLSKGASHA